MTGAPEDTIRISLGDTLRMLRRADPEIAAEVTTELRGLAKEAADLARAKAAGQGFTAPGTSGRGTGRLIEKIGYSVRGTTALIRETAVSERAYLGRDSSRHTYPDGYPYPAIFEFGRKASWMNRPFLMPTVHDIAPKVVAGIEAAVDRAIHRL